VIFTSYHPVYTLDSPRGAKGYHRFHLGKTREFAVLWYLYVRRFLGDEHITIVDQGGDLSIDHLLAYANEPYDTGVADDHEVFDLTGPRLHIRRFETKAGLREGVKRLYHYLYKTCWRNHLDLFFIENDCLVAKDWLTPCRAVDFATNNICAPNHRACDTYINWVSARRLHDMDALCPLDQWLDWVKATYGDYQHENDWDALYDVSSTILNERGAYLRFCYGDVLTFNGDKVMHSVEGDADRLRFLRDNPIDHPFYRSFMEQATHATAPR
jgi:hypothetical protein